MKHETAWVRITALLCVTLLAAIALLSGVNGAIFGFAMTAIGAIVGTTLKPITQYFKTEKPKE